MSWLADHLADIIGLIALSGTIAFAWLYQSRATWTATRQGRAIMYLARAFIATVALLIFFSFLPDILSALGHEGKYRSWRWIPEAIVYTPLAWACWNMFFALRAALGLPAVFVVMKKHKGGRIEMTNGESMTFGEYPETVVNIAAETPTQVKNPGRTSWRTFVQAALGGLVLVNPVFLAIQQVMQETTSIVFPGWAWATVNAVVLGSALVSTLVSRIMAIPGVNQWIEEHIHSLAPSSER